ncbi:MAG: glycosyltransferase family 39 protein [Silvibacterium sp.]|nr:glycosyltransferase family 39 protein [Silvibacterium sp.]
MSSSRPLDIWVQKWFTLVVLALLLVLAAQMFFSARLESQTFDEPAHLYAGYSYWLRSDFGINPEHPPLVKLVASLPLLVERPKYPEPTNFYFRADSVFGGIQLMNMPAADTRLARARMAVSVFIFLLALLVVLASREMFDQKTALFALALFVFDPMLLANGPLLGTDVGGACFIFATVYAFYRYVKRPSLARLGIVALAAGLALAAKHSSILVLPILIFLAAIEVVIWQPGGEATMSRSAQGRRRIALRLCAALVVIAAVSVTILWAFYGFRYAARPGGGQIVPPTAEFLKTLNHPVEAHVIGFAMRHHLLPEAYLYGFTDITILSREGRPMFLFGKLYPAGRWFYFPAAFLIKSTIGFLLLLALLSFARVVWRSESRREILFLLVPAVVYFGSAMTSKLNIGIRHVLPVMPFLIVLAAAGAISLARRSRVWTWAVSIILAFHIASSLRAFPDYLPYSNEIFGGVDNTHRVLADANVGWEGGLKALHAYIEKKQIRQCWFAYSGPPNPVAFQIPCRQLPTWLTLYVDHGPFGPVPETIEGPVFLSSYEVSGSTWGSDEMNPYEPFVPMQPAHVVAGEILEYDGPFPVTKVAAASENIVALTLLNQHNIDQAVIHAEKAVALDPGSLAAHETLATAYAAHHQPDDALREYHTAQHLYATVHPDFQGIEDPPQNPLHPSPQ